MAAERDAITTGRARWEKVRAGTAVRSAAEAERRARREAIDVVEEVDAMRSAKSWRPKFNPAIKGLEAGSHVRWTRPDGEGAESGSDCDSDHVARITISPICTSLNL